MVSPAKSPPHPPCTSSAATLPPIHPRPRSAGALTRHSFPVTPPPLSVASTHSTLSPQRDDSNVSLTIPHSAASVFTPPPHSAVDVFLPDGEPLFPALSSPPVLVTHTHSFPSYSALPHVSRDPRVQSLPASDMQLLPDASDGYRFSSHLSIDTRASSSHTALLHASPSASPPLVSSPPVTPAYGSDDGRLYEQHRTRRQRR